MCIRDRDIYEGPVGNRNFVLGNFRTVPRYRLVDYRWIHIRRKQNHISWQARNSDSIAPSSQHRCHIHNNGTVDTLMVLMIEYIFAWVSQLEDKVVRSPTIRNRIETSRTECQPRLDGGVDVLNHHATCSAPSNLRHRQRELRLIRYRNGAGSGISPYRERNFGSPKVRRLVRQAQVLRHYDKPLLRIECECRQYPCYTANTAGKRSLGDHVHIDPAICGGCGLCGAVCPSGAAQTAYPPADHLFSSIASLLNHYREAGGKMPFLLLHDGTYGAEMIETIARYGRGLPANMLPVSMHAMGRAGHDVMVASIALGYHQVFVLLNPTSHLGYTDLLNSAGPWVHFIV